MTSSLPDDLRESQEIPRDVADELYRVAPRLGSIARSVHWLRITASTNDVAAHLAESGASEGTVVIAEAQTAGRGRHGRSWFSPAGAGLYVSVILKPPNQVAVCGGENRAGLLTLAAGVAIAQAVRTATGLPAEIKWPNDVTISRRKVAGILTEAATRSSGLSHVVLGFGVNLRTAAYPPELAARVTSIEAETGHAPDRALLLAEIVASLAERYGELCSGKFDAILSAWRQLAPTLRSAAVEWDSAEGVVRGHAEGIDDDGALLVRVNERLERLIAGEIRWV